MAMAPNSTVIALHCAAAIALIVAALVCCREQASHRSEQANAVPRGRPSHKVRVAAARLRVHSDRQVGRGRTTPRWVIALSGQDG